MPWRTELHGDSHIVRFYRAVRRVGELEECDISLGGHSMGRGSVTVAEERLVPVRCPHFYVYADSRYQTCLDLECWMNGGSRPAWAKSLRRDGRTCVHGRSGISISARGPYVLPPGDNGRMAWQEDSCAEQSAMREFMAWALVNIGELGQEFDSTRILSARLN